MGQSKLLLPLKEKPVARHCLETIIASGIEDIVIVLGMDGDPLAKAVDGLPVRIAFNRNIESDMAESVRAGLHQVDTGSSGVLICLADHPLVSVETFRTLVRSHIEDPDKIMIPSFLGRRGHPTLFPMPVVREIFSLQSLREVVHKDPDRVSVIPVTDEGGILDMDTPEDYKKICDNI